MENKEDTVLTMVRVGGVDLDSLREALNYIWEQEDNVDIHNTKLISYDNGMTFNLFVDSGMNLFAHTNNGGIVSIDRTIELRGMQGTTSKRRPYNIFCRFAETWRPYRECSNLQVWYMRRLWRFFKSTSQTDSSAFLHPFWTKYYISASTRLVCHISFADNNENEIH